jgi:hypothetical protein
VNSDSRLLVPDLDDEPYPTLGREVCDYIEANLCYGPGDLIGQPRILSTEEAYFVYRAYELYPRGHAMEGRRRFKQVALSRRKGVAKTEIMALVAICECSADCPVRFDGWDANGEPVGRPVVDPYIPMLAYTEEQVEELAYRAVYEILAHSKIGDEWDLTLERVGPKDTTGRIVPLANSPSARDGARTTFQGFDEPHLMVMSRQKNAHATMLRNIPKRKAADPWSLYTSTMYGPGEGSVFEDLHTYALAIARGEIKDSRLYFDHRQAAETWNIARARDLRAAIIEASGDAAAWADVDSIIALYNDPSTDENTFRRYWLNQRRRTAHGWTIVPLWGDLAEPGYIAPDGAEIVLGFDGSYSRDTTALVGCTVEEVPRLFVIGAWEKPLTSPAWRVPRRDVRDAVAAAMERWTVLEFAPDPPGWVSEIEEWEETYGEVVVRFETNQPKRMGPAVDDFEQAVRDGGLRHDGSEILSRHLGNCVPMERAGRTVMTKEHPDSPDKIDAAVCAIVALHRAKWHFAHPEDEGIGVILPSDWVTPGTEAAS